ncbi:trypsin-like peptidase domain-containing protein [Nocardia cyriacigeorgica]|uniref:S1C family serine protease n=1 Tax=Nocardia cyriacigeorgica TaxID=135487 RepID=UPI00189344B8|nr:trypsin-like peptidase domain-containing protein [Nocardia cyriacigeorgica]MBF6086572.1 trypsin-like peptidase domain-containing protein [Nocardia cyriacigeorgica]MBF6091115.1 trypsin-like peptidase domain-containing protein [Nocardia cyriacigeorgica]MBF6160998.1 trypsin-like peptidase domain-containing protein [Nocardia cyriacigeorgica]MBF6201011.1 trypsin-like peptidase domain-containing protein [Nocardia cyriacigeorgica]MBF6322011.1 trypsin-like peptidase domain-containing protein [Nocar
MTTESTNTGSADTSDSAANRGNLRPPDAPVLGPRPVYRPHVDTHTARAFRRPNGQAGSFAPRPGSATAAQGPDQVQNRPPDAVLAEAFGRPEGSDELLQRDPDAVTGEPEVAGPADPWRDPESGARLGAPALPTPAARTHAEATKLSAREVLFGSRVAPRALALLAAIALVIGLIGGLVGRLTAETASTLTSRKVALEQTGDPEQPHGQIAQVADAVLPSVVSIRTTVGDNGATGSGVVIDGNGYIATNNHVISMAAQDGSGNAKIQVMFSDGTRVPANIVGRDTKTDLAVLKVDVKNLTVAQLGKSEDVRVGDAVLAIGSPLGLSKTVTSGIVSALHRPVKLEGEGSDTKAVIDAVQTDASINPGNSGGALVDMEGRVVGINTAIRSETGGSVGLGFAVPVDVVTDVAQTLIRDGVKHHPVIGLSARTKAVANEAMSGAEVADVAPGGPAARAGIVEGDVIVKVGDREVTGPEELVVAVQANKIGDTVTVRLIREGRQVDVPVTLESD